MYIPREKLLPERPASCINIVFTYDFVGAYTHVVVVLVLGVVLHILRGFI